MKRSTFWKVGAGLLVAGALAACGGGGSHDGSVEPDPPEAPPQSKVVFGWDQPMPVTTRSLVVLHTSVYDA